MEDCETLDIWEPQRCPESDPSLTDDGFGSFDVSPIWSPTELSRISVETPDSNDSPVPTSAGETDSQSKAGHHREKTKKGYGPESKAKAPDPHDYYDFETLSPSYIRLRLVGYEGFTLDDIVLLCNRVENLMLMHGRPTSDRNRAARRRKPNAFHWLDENWSEITPQLYDAAAFAVLGSPAFPKARNRRGATRENKKCSVR
jgi:hypothetical protein